MGMSSICCVTLVAVNQFNAGILILRVIFGLFLAYHGYNKFFGPSGLAGHCLVGSRASACAGRSGRPGLLPRQRLPAACWWPPAC